MARRVRREFGAPYHFTDRNVADAKDGHVECTPYQDGSYDLKKIELDKGTQVGHSWCIGVHPVPGWELRPQEDRAGQGYTGR